MHAVRATAPPDPVMPPAPSASLQYPGPPHKDMLLEPQPLPGLQRQLDPSAGIPAAPVKPPLAPAAAHDAAKHSMGPPPATDAAAPARKEGAAGKWKYGYNVGAIPHTTT